MQTYFESRARPSIEQAFHIAQRLEQNCIILPSLSHKFFSKIRFGTWISPLLQLKLYCRPRGLPVDPIDKILNLINGAQPPQREDIARLLVFLTQDLAPEIGCHLDELRSDGNIAIANKSDNGQSHHTRRGRMTKSEYDEKHATFLAITSAYPAMIHDPTVLGKNIGISRKTARRWIDESRLKYENSKSATMDASD